MVVVLEVTMWLLSSLERILKPVVSQPHLFVKAGTNIWRASSVPCCSPLSLAMLVSVSMTAGRVCCSTSNHLRSEATTRDARSRAA